MKTFLIFILSSLPLILNAGTCYQELENGNVVCDATTQVAAPQADFSDPNNMAADCCQDLQACDDTDAFGGRLSCSSANSNVSTTALCATSYCMPSDDSTCCEYPQPTRAPTQGYHNENEISSSEARTSLVVTIVMMALLCACGVSFFTCLSAPDEPEGWLMDSQFNKKKKKGIKVEDSESESESSS